MESSRKYVDGEARLERLAEHSRGPNPLAPFPFRSGARKGGQEMRGKSQDRRLDRGLTQKIRRKLRNEAK